MMDGWMNRFMVTENIQTRTARVGVFSLYVDSIIILCNIFSELLSLSLFM